MLRERLAIDGLQPNARGLSGGLAELCRKARLGHSQGAESAFGRLNVTPKTSPKTNAPTAPALERFGCTRIPSGSGSTSNRC